MRTRSAVFAILSVALAGAAVYVLTDALRLRAKSESVVLAAEQCNMLVRVAESGDPVALRIGVDVEDDEDGLDSHNVFAEFAAKEIFDAWLEPLRDRGVRRNVIEGIGSTDHVPFVQQGVPAFTTIKDLRHYDVRTRHTNANFADAVAVEDLRQSASVLAVVAWQAAMRDEPFPRLVAAQSP